MNRLPVILPMAVSAAQEAAFVGGTQGIAMTDFQLAILGVFFSLLYLWAAWVIYSQWMAWSNRKITFYAFLTRCVRCVLVTLFASFLLT